MKAAKILNSVGAATTVHSSLQSRSNLIPSVRSAFAGLRLHSAYTNSPSYSRQNPAQPPSAYQGYNNQDQAYSNTASASIQEVDYDPVLANSIMLIGTIGRKPEIKYLETGKKVASASIAIRQNKDAPSQW